METKLMNTELIGESWDQLAGKHEEMVSSFYDRFLTQYPDYKPLFSGTMERQKKKMLETMALIARVTQDTEIAHPHLVKMGSKHIQYKLGREDLEKFKQVFLQVIGEYCVEWTDEYQQAWNEAFDKHVIPYMEKGMNLNPAH
jgi:hemoglobin-like flavoprotein